MILTASPLRHIDEHTFLHALFAYSEILQLMQFAEVSYTTSHTHSHRGLAAEKANANLKNFFVGPAGF